jgi:hypothetical protein
MSTVGKRMLGLINSSDRGGGNEVSTCISRYGEYSSHITDTCSRCGFFTGVSVEEQAAGMVPRNWHGLMVILDDIYPESVFPTVPDREDRDLGPRIISLLRRLDRAQDGCT